MKEGTIRDKRGRTYKPSVVRKYERALRLDVVPHIGSVPIAALGRGDVQRLIDDLAANRSAEHARQALTALRVALRVAEPYGKTDGNVCAAVTVPATSEEVRRPRPLTPDEARVLIAAAELDDAERKRSFAAPFFALLLSTGLRTGEALALQYGPDGLDLDAGYVRVRATLDRAGTTGEFRLLSPKSRASRRDVPLAPEDVRRLRVHRLATGRPSDGAFVFASPGGGPLPAQGLPRSTWRRLLGLQATQKAKPTRSRLPNPMVVLADPQPVNA